MSKVSEGLSSAISSWTPTKEERLMQYLGALNNAPKEITVTEEYLNAYESVMTSINKELSL